MITERELLQAIQECESDPVTMNKIEKLADFYIVYDHLFGDRFDRQSSYLAEKPEKTIEVNGGSDFLIAVRGKPIEGVLLVIDELMEATRVLHPRMYDSVFRKIYDL